MTSIRHDDQYTDDELIVLSDEIGSPAGTMPRSDVHHADTPLHFGFSVFLFNRRGELLLQQRSFSKKTWPGVWSNSCCGHPMPGESVLVAAARRLAFELGIDDAELHVVLPNFRYRAEKGGIVENEICPVLVGFADAEPRLNPDEVAAARWIAFEKGFEMIRRPEEGFSAWAILEAGLLEKSAEFHRLIAERTGKR